MTHTIYCKPIFSEFNRKPVYQVVYRFKYIYTCDYVGTTTWYFTGHSLYIQVNRKIPIGAIINPTKELNKYLEGRKS